MGGYSPPSPPCSTALGHSQQIEERFQETRLGTVLGSLLFKSNSLHITLYFEDDLCITVTYYLETKVTIVRILSYSYILLRNKVTINILSYMHLEIAS